MEIEHVEDLYARELEEVFGIPFDNLAVHDELIELSLGELFHFSLMYLYFSIYAYCMLSFPKVEL